MSNDCNFFKGTALLKFFYTGKQSITIKRVPTHVNKNGKVDFGAALGTNARTVLLVVAVVGYVLQEARLAASQLAVSKRGGEETMYEHVRVAADGRREVGVEWHG